MKRETYHDGKTLKTTQNASPIVRTNKGGFLRLRNISIFCLSRALKALIKFFTHELSKSCHAKDLPSFI